MTRLHRLSSLLCAAAFVLMAVLLGAIHAPTKLQKYPVELASFDAVGDGENAVKLGWQTASETNNAGFEVQRQLGDEDWKALGFVQSKAEGGTTAEAQSYGYRAEDVPAGSQYFRLKQVDLDGDSTFTDTVSVNVLPVELAEFQGTASKRGALLTWKTAVETNNAGFEVQWHKESGWTQVGYVESKAKGGTTTEAKSYSYKVKELPVGTHHFRLKQVDVDGSTTFHGPIAVQVKMREALKLTAPSPNPVSHTTTVSFATKERAEVRLTLYDILGRQVRSLYEGTPTAGQSQDVELDVSRLPSGTYILRFRADGKTTTERVTVAR